MMTYDCFWAVINKVLFNSCSGFSLQVLVSPPISGYTPGFPLQSRSLSRILSLFNKLLLRGNFCTALPNLPQIKNKKIYLKFKLCHSCERHLFCLYVIRNTIKYFVINFKLRLMKSISVAILLLSAITLTNCTSSNMMGNSSKPVMVGGAEMFSTKNIVENAMNSSEHTTLVAAVKAAGLVETLQGAGPFTVFAPTNAAFDMLPAGSVDLLVKPYNKMTLTKILTSHVVAGRMSGADLAKMVKDGNGTATLTTLSGHKLMLSRQGDAILVKDENGGTAVVTTANVYQSNGVIHVIDHVLIPS